MLLQYYYCHRHIILTLSSHHHHHHQVFVSLLFEYTSFLFVTLNVTISRTFCQYLEKKINIVTTISRGKEWQTTPKNLPRMQCARAIPVT